MSCHSMYTPHANTVHMSLQGLSGTSVGPHTTFHPLQPGISTPYTPPNPDPRRGAPASHAGVRWAGGPCEKSDFHSCHIATSATTIAATSALAISSSSLATFFILCSIFFVLYVFVLYVCYIYSAFQFVCVIWVVQPHS